MSVYVDRLVEYALGTVKGAERVKYWCHMFADTELELHDMAQKIGMRRSWYQSWPEHSLPHYDLSQTRRASALNWGAVDWGDHHLTLEDFKRFRWGMQRGELPK